MEQAELPIIIITYRDLFQWIAKQRGANDELQKSRILQLSAIDVRTLGIEDNSSIKVTSSSGTVVVKAKIDPNCSQGFGYMPIGTYSHELVGYNPQKAKLPNFKHIEALVEPAIEDTDA